MEILAEILLQVLQFLAELFIQFVVEAVFEGAAEGVVRALRHRTFRLVTAVTAVVGLGFGCGVWWGARLTESGRTEQPRSLWVSIALAVVFAAASVYRLRRDGTQPTAVDEPHPQIRRPLLAPWRWTAARLAVFATLNVGVALGITVGFEPHPRQ
jgi:hypothetical protein